MQRRIEQPDGHRQALHDLEQFDEIRALHRQQLGERRAAAVVGVGEDHLAHGEDAVVVEEHVLGAAQADALGAEGARRARVGRGLGVGAHPQPARGVRPFHQPGEIAGEFRLAHGDRARQDLAGRAVDGDGLALLEDAAAGAHRSGLVVDAHAAGAGDAGLAHAARHHRRVAGHAAARGQDALGGVHAVDVLRAGLDAHQDDLAPLLLERLRLVRGEDDLARGRARRSRQAGGDQVALGLRVDRRVQQLVERRPARCAAPPRRG